MKRGFTKMHGCGNDFAVFEGLSRQLKLEARLVRELADRRFGIGFDQLLVLEPPLRPTSDFALAIYNSDGSPAAHCGNGARCAAQFALENSLTLKKSLTWDLATGGSAAETFATEQVGANQFKVRMGVPGLEPADVPFRPSDATKGPGEHGWTLELEKENIDFVPIGLGNPHAMVLVEDLDAASVQALGVAFGQHPAFPEGVNVGFCELKDKRNLKLRVFERGVGETMACGSGACAAVAACALLGKVDSEVRIALPGGDLNVEWQGPGREIHLIGPAATCFQGQLTL